MQTGLYKALALLITALLLAACESPTATPIRPVQPVAPKVEPTAIAPTKAAQPMTAAPTKASQPTTAVPTKAAQPTTAAPTKAPPPTSQPTSARNAEAPLFYNLPPAVLTSATGLYASPNRGDLIVPVPIPARETVFVMGRNATSSHLRIVWNTGVGWVPTSFTNYNGARDRLASLPVFTREPPGCAVPLTTQFGLNSRWTADQKRRIAVVVDLFRSRYGDFPRSTLALTANGKDVDSSRRPIVEQGQFSLKDVVFTLPADVQPGDVVGYHLETTSNEPLTFMATIFAVPNECKWKLD
jgi:hypothetical protein